MQKQGHMVTSFSAIRCAHVFLSRIIELSNLAAGFASFAVLTIFVTNYRIVEFGCRLRAIRGGLDFCHELSKFGCRLRAIRGGHDFCHELSNFEIW